MRSTTLAILFTAAAVLLPSRTALAQDMRWEPWLGCWDRTATDVRDDTGRPADETRPEESSVPRVCVTRNGNAGVTLSTTVPGQPPIEQALVPDGSPHPVSENSCSGTETTTWSRTGRLLFAKATVTCANGGTRTVSGLALITDNDDWLDLRSIDIGGQPATRVSRYRRVVGDSAIRIPASGGSSLTIGEIKEASAAVSASVLEAAVAETNPELTINRHTLLDLADAHVPPTVIDVLVALAYPDRFVVERATRSAPLSAQSVPGRPIGPYGIDDYLDTGFYYPAYYYSPFGYSYLGLYDPFLFGPYSYGGYVSAPGRVYSGGGGGGLPVTPSGTARAVNGQGYTRIRPNTEQPAAEARPGAAGGRSRAALATGGDSGSSSGRSSSTTSSGGASSSTSSSSSGSSASPEGFSGGGASSGGGSGDGGGRTAQPR